MQSIQKQSKPVLRWFTRSAIGFALACSVCLVGSASAQQSVNINSYPDWESAWRTFYQQWHQWIVETYGRELESWLQANPDIQAGTITNFLGQVDYDEMLTAFNDAFIPTFFSWIESKLPEKWETWAQISSWFTYPGDAFPYIAVGTMSMSNDGQPVFDEPLLNVMGNLWENHWYPDLQALVAGVSSNGAAAAAQSNLVISAQMATYAESNQTTIASVYEKLDALESTPTDEEIQESTDADTYTNAVPTSPLQLGSVDVDTSSMESVLDPITDGLDGLIPNESTTKPKIVMMQGNRSSETVEVELNLDGLEAVTRILRVLYKVGLWVGVIGILRSEWAFWSTLGGSAT